MISDEEVQSKGDVGASKDPPRKKSFSFKSKQHFVPGIVVDLLHRLECVSSIPGLFIFLVLKFMTRNILDRYATVYTQEHFQSPFLALFVSEENHLISPALLGGLLGHLLVLWLQDDDIQAQHHMEDESEGW